MEQEKKELPIREATMTIECTLSREAISGIFANGLWQGFGGFDDIDFDKEKYAGAKAELLAYGMSEDGIAIEDVEAQMLLRGDTLKLHMAEEREDEEWYELTLDKLIEGIKKYAKNPINGGLSDVLSADEDCRLDATDYDAILQYACYGDILIG